MFPFRRTKNNIPTKRSNKTNGSRATTTEEKEPSRDVTKEEGPPVQVAEEKQLTDQQRAAITKFVRSTLAIGIEKLKTEYEQLKEFKPPDSAKTAFSANVKKCRYKDVLCWDRTRVKLTFGEEGDFIHANHVAHPILSNKFICCQGPLDATVNDFWRMVWQEHVPLIIMLCQVKELGKTKCAQYWPVKEGEFKSYGKVKVTCDSVDTKDPNITVRKLAIEVKKEKRYLEHRQWVTWPDKTVPKSSSVAFRLLHFPREYTNHPSIVHCSAGVGRTGTLVALELVLRKLLGNEGDKVSIPEIVKELRCCRSQAVQTEDQYVYIHFAMCQYAVMKKILPREEIEAFIKEYEEYLKNVELGTPVKDKKKPAASVEKIEEEPPKDIQAPVLVSPEEIKEEEPPVVPFPVSTGAEKSILAAQPTLYAAAAVVANIPQDKKPEEAPNPVAGPGCKGPAQQPAGAPAKPSSPPRPLVAPKVEQPAGARPAAKAPPNGAMSIYRPAPANAPSNGAISVYKPAPAKAPSNGAISMYRPAPATPPRVSSPARPAMSMYQKISGPTAKASTGSRTPRSTPNAPKPATSVYKMVRPFPGQNTPQSPGNKGPPKL